MKTPILLSSVLLLAAGPWAAAQPREAATVDAAANVLAEIMSMPARSIPLSLLRDAQGVVIIPGMIKGGFVIGVRHGSGVVLRRDEAGNWTPPMLCSMTGASIGWQAGLQGTDVVLVFTTKNSLQGMLQNKITLGADVAAAAGPVGREAAVGTDARLKAEIYSYSRSRGLFAGASLDGSVLRVDQAATADYYRAPPGANPQQPIPLPAEAARLLAQLAQYTGAPVAAAAPPVAASAPAVAAPAVADAAAVRSQLAESARQLSLLLDDNWRRYLALPAEVYGGASSPEAVAAALARFDSVAATPSYAALANRTEFQATRDLLRRYQAALPAVPLNLPPPPK